MTSFFVVFWPWVVGALLGAIVAGVVTRHQPEWYVAIVHCVGSAYVGAGVTALFVHTWFVAIPVGPAYFGFFHVLMFWVIVPVLFGSVAALFPKREQE